MRGFEREHLVLSVALKVVPTVRGGMTRDASLTEFGVGGTADETTDDVAPMETDGTGPAPVRSTSRWTDEPRPCADCGDDVQRTWAVEDRQLCADCKEW